MLPQVLPMLAVSAAPFDASDYLFEVKWDGVRALAAVDAHAWRLWGRRGSDYTTRYPEWEVLRQLPAGTLVDGELVVFRDGRADLARLLQRHHLVDGLKIRQARRWCPVHYVLFDLLYHAGQCLLHEPLARRRAVLSAVFTELAQPGIVFSAGVQGRGRACYEAAVALGHEGVMAKAAASVYRPGRRARRGRRSSRTAAPPHPVPKAKRPGDAPLRVHPPNHSAPPRIGPSGPRSLTRRPVPARERLPPTSRGPAPGPSWAIGRRDRSRPRQPERAAAGLREPGLGALLADLADDRRVQRRRRRLALRRGPVPLGRHRLDQDRARERRAGFRQHPRGGVSSRRLGFLPLAGLAWGAFFALAVFGAFASPAGFFVLVAMSRLPFGWAGLADVARLGHGQSVTSGLRRHPGNSGRNS